MAKELGNKPFEFDKDTSKFNENVSLAFAAEYVGIFFSNSHIPSKNSVRKLKL